MNLKDRMLEYDPRPPRNWRPRPGSVLTGTVRRYDHAYSPYGPSWICVLEDDEGGDLVAVWITSLWLTCEFSAKRPMPGERIGIRQLDNSEGFDRYVLLVEGRKPESDVPDFWTGAEDGDHQDFLDLQAARSQFPF